jgi:uncharacterized protein YidB (DUF937 family)
MSMMDQITAALGGAQGAGGAGGQQQGLIAGLMKMLNNPQVGGVSGLITKLQSAGLGSAVSSWLGTGPNQPVSGQQLQSALGDEPIDQVAKEAGVSKQEASDGLATLLPGLVDKLSRDGKLPADLTQGAGQGQGEAGGLGGMIGSLKDKFFGGPKQ